jgi:hypothetical protein
MRFIILMAVAFLTIVSLGRAATPQDYQIPDGGKWLQIASRANDAEAIELAKNSRVSRLPKMTAELLYR